MLRSHHFAIHRNIIISKCSLLSLLRVGRNFLPPSETSLSTAALAGSVVFRVMYGSLTCGYMFRGCSSFEAFARYLSTSAATSLSSPASFCLFTAIPAKNDGQDTV